MSFCLDDGAALLFGPASMDEPETAILTTHNISSEQATGSLGQVSSPVATPFTGTTQSAWKKNSKIAGVFGIILVAALGIGSYVYYGGGSARQINSIAVMPFTNDSGNAENEYLSEGMTETLIASLSQIAGLNVKARSSVFRYKGKETDAKTVGRELGVQTLLSGRLIRGEDGLMLSLELVDATTENSIWSQQYVFKVTDLVSLQRQVARDVSNKLKTKLSSTDVSKIGKTYTSNTEAYQQYLQGRFYWNKQSYDAMEKSIDFYNKAIVADPNFGDAFASLALSYLWTGNRDAARNAAVRALSIDDELAKAHLAIGAIKVSEFDWAHGEKELRRAVELDSKDAVGHDFLGIYLAWIGKPVDAEREMHLALDSDPLSLVVNRHFAACLTWARDYDRAVIQLQGLLQREPDFVYGYIDLGNNYQFKGQTNDAISSFNRALELDPGNSSALAGLAITYAKSDRIPDARKIVSKLDSEFSTNGPYESLVKIHASLGEKDIAFMFLEKAIRARDEVVDLKVDPSFDSLRDDVRFAVNLKLLGLPE